MAETIQTLGDFPRLLGGGARAAEIRAEARQGRAYATGKRKDAVARVGCLVPARSSSTIVRWRPISRPVLRMLIQQPLVAPTPGAI